MSSVSSPEQIQWAEAHPDQTLQPELLSASIVGLVLAYIAVVLRFLGRHLSQQRFGWDDWLILASLASLTAFGVTGCVNVGYGQGKHTIFVNNPKGIMEGFITGMVAYCLTNTLSKASILVFYCRIFRSRVLRHISWALSIFIFLYGLALVLVSVLACIPFSATWSNDPAKCIDTDPARITVAAVNLVVDVLILSIPVRFVVRLRMDIERKIHVIGVFLSGAIVCIFGLLRVIAVAKQPPGDESYNQTWPGIALYGEMFVGIIAACLPIQRIFFVRLRQVFIPNLRQSFASKVARASKHFSRSSNKSTSTQFEKDAELAKRILTQSSGGTTLCGTPVTPTFPPNVARLPSRHASSTHLSSTQVSSAQIESRQASSTHVAPSLDIIIPSPNLQRHSMSSETLAWSTFRSGWD